MAPMYDALSCTRAFWNDNESGAYVGRSMDWAISTDPEMIFFPANISRNGGMLGGEIKDPKPMIWTSQYASLVTSAYNAASVDGINEKGLAIHLLFLTESDFGTRVESLKGVHAGLWGQYLLDNASTVEEALELMKEIQVFKVNVNGFDSNLHLAIEDKTGDSAIIEYIDGKPVVHHGREYKVMTNDPQYDVQLENVKQYCTNDGATDKPCFDGATRETKLPGNASPKDRFVRATYFLEKLISPKNEADAVASITSIIRNTSVPFDAPSTKPNNFYNTEYRTAMNLSNNRYFFELAKSPSIFWVTLDDFLQKKQIRSGEAKTMKLRKEKIYSLSLHGNVIDQFEALDSGPY